MALLDASKRTQIWFSNRMATLNTIISTAERSVCKLRITARTVHGTIDWFQIGKGAHQGCILSPCLFNLYAEYIMQKARLDEA